MEIKLEWIDAQDYRVSTRTYGNQPIENEKINHLKAFIQRINEESKLHFQYVEDCGWLFSNFFASYGLIKGAKSSIVLVGNKKVEKLKNQVGYFGEMLVLEATVMGIGTCWLGGTYDKKACKKILDLKEDEEIIAVIALGYSSENRGLLDKVLVRMKDKKKSFDDILIEKEDVPNWVKGGIEAVMKAPSAVNKQPFGYSYKNGVINAYTTAENHGHEEVDLGISMLHFQLGAMKEGHTGKWYDEGKEKVYK